MTTRKERDLFIAQFCRQLPEWVRLYDKNGKDKGVVRSIDAARLILRHAKTHGNLAVAECNGPGDYVNNVPYPEAGKIYERFAAFIEKRQGQIERRIASICEPFNVRADFGGDPRGYTVKLHLPEGTNNTWGQDGYGVPQ